MKTSLLNDTIRSSPNGELDGGTVSFSPEDFPMIEGISCLDLRREHLETSRAFSRQNDLWIADHRPLKSAAHPLVAAGTASKAVGSSLGQTAQNRHKKGVTI